MALPTYTPDRRREVASLLEIDEQYLYQIIKGLKFASPSLARRWHQIDPAAILQELRPDDWQQIWPELIGTQGATANPSPVIHERKEGGLTFGTRSTDKAI